MNRNEEYRQLLSQLNQTPPELEGTVQRACSRAKKVRRLRTALGVPVGSLAACFAAFILLVNLFPPFAMACGSVPLLRKLAKTVAWSPSLSAAVENEYVQPIEQTQTKNGITARVEYVIVDQKQVNFFYTLQSENGDQLEADPTLLGEDGNRLEGHSLSSGGFNTPNGELRSCTADFMDIDVPGTVRLALKVYSNDTQSDAADGTAPAPVSSVVDDMMRENRYTEPDYLAEFFFDLAFDAYYTAQGKMLTVEQTFTLDGQTLTLADAELYPTHIRLNFRDDPANTAWLRGLEFYLENQKGETFAPISNGISATGNPDTPMTDSYRVESDFFRGSTSLTLHITRATWLDKDKERIRVDLKNETADILPQGVELDSAERRGGGWLLQFSAQEFEENHSYQLFSSLYYDADGMEYEICSWSSNSGDGTGRFDETFPLVGYTADEVWLCPHFTRFTTLPAPLTIPVQ